MAIDINGLRLIFYPDPILRRRTKKVSAIDGEVRRVAARMLQIMHEAPGVGLAAPQVGLDWRLFVACPTGDPKDDAVFINPLLSNPSREMDEYEEGCLSIPNVTANIRRPKAITIHALDLKGSPITESRDDLLARIWQHECDHLDGVLILDRMSPIDRMANKQAIAELERKWRG
jgi:peptide deformylase